MSIRIASVVFFAMSIAQGASAADLPLAPKFYDWTGVYVGANVGYGSASISESTDTAGTATTSTAQTISGLLAGGQVGANLQFGGVVVGAEIDGEWSGLRSAASGATVDFKIPWLATARLRIGFAHDRIHYYLTGGAGYMQFSRADASGVFLSTTSQARTAWVIGAGSESAINRNLILRFEVLYLRLLGNADTLFGTVTTTGGTTTTTAATTESGYDIIGRVGLSYKFGWSN